MNDSLTVKKPFSVAGLLFIIHGCSSLILNLCQNLYNYNQIQETHRESILTSYIFNYSITLIGLALLIIAGILLIIKKDNCVSVTVVLGIRFLHNLTITVLSIISATMLIVDTSHIEIITIYLKSIIINSFSIVLGVVFILFCLISLIRKNKKSSFLSLWYLPAILHSISFFYNCYINGSNIYKAVSENGFKADFLPEITFMIIGLIISAISIAAITLFCFGLFKVNRLNSEAVKCTYDTNCESNDIQYEENDTSIQSEPVYVATEYIYTEPAEVETPQTVSPASYQSMHPADDIIKYKQLLDMGILTQEEFETKKKQILNL